MSFIDRIHELEQARDTAITSALGFKRLETMDQFLVDAGFDPRNIVVLNRFAFQDLLDRVRDVVS